MNMSILRSVSVTAATGALVLGGTAAASADTDSRSSSTDRSSGFSLGAPLSFGESTFGSSKESAERISQQDERSTEQERDARHSSSSESSSSSSESESSRDKDVSFGGFSIDPTLTVVNEASKAVAAQESRDRGGEDREASQSERHSSDSRVEGRAPVQFDGLSFSSQKESAEREEAQSERESEQRDGRGHDAGTERSSSSSESVQERADRSNSDGSIGGLEADPNLSSQQSEQRESDRQQNDDRDRGGLLEDLLGSR